MSLTGVKVDPQCVQLFNELKMGHNLKYIVYAFNKERSRIIVERTGEDEDITYEEFIDTLPKNECRYVIFNFDFEHSYMGTSITAKCERILLLLWCPSTSKIREKMLFASSKRTIRKALDGVQVEVQGTDYTEIDYDTVYEKATRNLRF
ncbi:hypothetical protein BCR32DRAFT_232385 [Anaeromyces robustus]|uniref:Cofilin n=1 Tax=Anaeromyces robustus TaxID=1754192 RepID=A0A1Y1X914_9FUNG|nr:hypothetical protein BCR32DRAFT_232385 [Anaeromyces robustus]|eukprot:ORX81906.1 hypothetical protein BCR32DRAFT_232385 [Anaeromyces robustus]